MVAHRLAGFQLSALDYSANLRVRGTLAQVKASPRASLRGNIPGTGRREGPAARERNRRKTEPSNLEASRSLLRRKW